MEINILIEEGFEENLGASWLQGIAEQALVTQDIGSGLELGLVITGQERVRQLNRSYLGNDEPTDVLAFPMLTEPLTGGESEASAPFVPPPDGVLHLGEVIVSYPQAVIQAGEHRHSLKKEIAILIIHGVLHLLGYDHGQPEPERRMKTREEETLNCIQGELD
jgi:probable rRNA maturation factor